MNELLNMTFGRIFHLFANSPIYTLYAFLCTAILGILFQVFCLNKVARANRVCLPRKHYIGVFVFLLYLAYVYQATGVGTIWIIGRYDTLIRMEEIALIPFAQFDGVHSLLSYALNIVMTMPFGFLLPLIWPEFRSFKKVALAGFAFSLFLELSQLLNRRATTTEDLITNVLGVLLGCFIYRILHRAIYKTKNFRPTRRSTSPIITYEAIIYLACSFVGIFFFFNSLLILPFGASNNIASTNNISTDTYVEGTIANISESTITVDGMETLVFENGKSSISNSGSQKNIITTEQTTVVLCQTDPEEKQEPVITPTTLDALSLHDLITVTGQEEAQGFVAQEITLWKFDL